MTTGLLPASDPLLAKSGDPGPGTTLQGHTWQVMESARLLLELRLAQAEQTVGRSMPALSRLVMLAAFLHDLGKANDAFQWMLRRKQKSQPVRHEALSLLIARRVLKEWLCSVYSSGEVDRAAVVAASHHRKFPGRAVAASGDSSASCVLQLSHPGFAKVLQLGVKHLGLPPAPASLLTDRKVERRTAEKLFDEAVDEIFIDGDDVELAVAKAFLLSSDVLGSIEPNAAKREAFVKKALSCRASRDELSSIAETRLSGEPPRPFQNEVANSSDPVTLVTAGCGSGKTIAAYLWARQYAGKQLWFCYPTTGTATEGFKGYLLNVGLETRLEHGRREVDIEDIFGLVDGDPAAEDPDEEALRRDTERLEALHNWGAQVVSCTVDTVLGLLQCQRKGMYAWPGLADAVFVFDEIHAYDGRLFGGLLRLIDSLRGAPVLLMTATLPGARLDRLRQKVRDVHGTELREIPGPADLERRPRYLHARIEPRAAVEACLAGGGKVLWVCNTVGRCQRAADEPWPVAPLRYHSRFRYVDRVARHKDVIAAFEGAGACLAITTQVCEMSLDLSADLLVTELAPVSSLIQRLGRLNRRAGPGDPPKPFVVVEPAGALPYSEAELDDARTWLSDPTFRKDGISQQDLAESWMRLGDGVDVPPDPNSNWLDGGVVTEPREVRDASPSLTILLERDATLVRQGAESIIRLAIPMSPPRTRAWMTWKRVKHTPVAPASAISYDPLRGAEWL